MVCDYPFLVGRKRRVNFFISSLFITLVQNLSLRLGARVLVRYTSWKWENLFDILEEDEEEEENLLFV